MASLFPFHIVFDRQLLVTQIGPSMRKIFPEMLHGTAFDSQFELQRPLIQITFESIAAATNSLFLLCTKQRQIRFRGQMVRMPEEDQIAFLCSPWLPEQGELGASGLTFEDFPFHGSMPEFLQVVQAQRLGMADLRKLTDKLRQQREALKLSNQRLLDQASESRKLALIAARTDNGVVITDAGGLVEWVNEGFVRITGYTLDEMRGKKPGDLLQGPETDIETVATMGEQLRSGEGFQCEIINYHKDGNKYWVAIEVQPIRNAAGQITNFMAMESDITARKEEALRKDLAHAVSTILAASTDADKGLEKILQIIMEDFGYLFGAVWRVDREKRRLLPAKILGVWLLKDSHFETATRNISFTRGEGLPGRVWESNAPHCISDLSADPAFLRGEAAKLDDLQSGFAFPIQVDGEPFGVIEFYSARMEMPGADFLRTLSALGNQIGQFLERNDAERERRRLVSLLGSTFESTKEGILVADLQRRFVSWNQRFLQIWGLSGEDVSDSHRDDVLRRAAHMVSNPQEFMRRVNWWYEHPEESGEDLIHFTNGRVFERVTQPQQSSRGVIGRVWSYRDVTERWRAEEALRESEERYRVISSTASDGIMSVNSMNVILFANEAAERMFGYEHGTLIGLNLSQLMGEEFSELDARGLMRVVRGSRVSAGSKATEVRARKYNGTEFPLEVTFGKAHIRGERVLTGVMRDVTERLAAESRLQDALATLRLAIQDADNANRAKSDFLASISHEIRTPLNTIAGLSDLLRGSQMTEDQQEMVNTVWASSELLLHLINDLLDISKIEAGEVDLMHTEFDMLAICEHAIEIVKPRAVSKRLALAMLTNPTVPARLFGDANRIRQILINLLGNGVKFTQHGSVSLHIDWKALSHRVAELTMEVRDTGIGIMPGEQDLIFEKFYRVDSEAVRRIGGTGLGLSISRRLAEAMGGSLTVSSGMDTGSSFCLKLRLDYSGEAAPKQASNDTAVLIASGEHANLLHGAWRSIGLKIKMFESLNAAIGYLDTDGECDFVILDAESAENPVELKYLMRLLALRGKVRCIRVRSPQGGSSSASQANMIDVDYPLTPGKLLRALQNIQPQEGAIPDARHTGDLSRPLQAAKSARVLLVEDNPESAAYFKRVLDKSGHVTTFAASMEAAVAWARRESFHVIFMDVMLPDGSGFDATRIIRKHEQTIGVTAVPIIALTAHALQDYRVQAFEAGMDDYLTKPVRKEALLAAVAKWTNRAVGSNRKAVDWQPVVDIDPDLADLIPNYLSKAVERLDLAESLIGAGKLNEARKIGHDLKGSGSGYGFTEVTRLGQMLEASAADGKEVEARDAIRMLRAYLKAVVWQPKH